MSEALDRLNAKLKEVREEVSSEHRVISLDKVNKPSLVDEVMGFDYSLLDSLGENILKKYLGALSQHLVFLSRHINHLSAERDCAEEEFKKYQSIAILSIDKNVYKTLEERKAESMKDQSLTELKNVLDSLNTKLTAHKNSPEVITNLIQTIKKALDSKTKEKISYE